jgi:hypothetical protein
MIPVTQDKFGERGNCLASCIASILELNLSDIPNFMDCNFNEDGTQNGNWWRELWKFCTSKGYEIWFRYGDSSKGQLPEMMEGALPYHLICGLGPRGYQHATVGLDGKIVHDPHPDRTGLVNITDFGFLLPIKEQHVKS